MWLMILVTVLGTGLGLVLFELDIFVDSGHTYLPVVPTEPFETVMNRDLEEKPGVTESQMLLLTERYDLRDLPSNVMMSGGTKLVQRGVRVKLLPGLTWEMLAAMSPLVIKAENLFGRTVGQNSGQNSGPGDPEHFGRDSLE
jgi:hypothetical protein